MEAMWSLSVKRRLGWGAHGECCTRASKVQHMGSGASATSLRHSMSAHAVHTLIVSSDHSGLLVSPAAEKKRDVSIVTIMEEVLHHTRNLSFKERAQIN